MSISVLIPIHNAEKTLERAVRSVLDQQTIQASEIVCVLNCCSDSSEEILKKLTEQHGSIKILKCDEKGIVPALNYGLDFCKGDWIARQDADDYWYPDKLEKQVNFLLKNPEVKVLGTQIRLVKPVTFETVSITNNPTDDAGIKQALFSAVNPIAHPSVVFKKDILLKTGTYSDLYPLCEDYFLWLRASKWYKMANLLDALVDYTSTNNPAYTPLSPQLAAHNMKLVLQHFPK